MTTLEINFPFDGFYGTVYGEYIDFYTDVSENENEGLMTPGEYDSIDWIKTFENIGKKYLEVAVEQNEELLKEFGITFEFVKIDSPKFYNFTTDRLVVEATFDGKKVLNLIKEKKWHKDV